MKIFIGLLCNDQGLRDFFGTSNVQSVVPPDATSRGLYAKRGVTLTLAAFSPLKTQTPEEFDQSLMRHTGDADCCLILTETDLAWLTENVRNATFVHVFSGEEVGSNYQNFFYRVTSRLLRIFGSLASIFENADDVHLLSLPLRNFSAKELSEIARLCKEANKEPDFINMVQAELVPLRKRRRPRKRSQFKTHYAVDDIPRFFKFGPEKHAQIDTAPPHQTHCQLNANFRFGVKIDSTRHFNVSQSETDKTHVSGEFITCHGEAQNENGKKTHLNMFSNDFY